MSALAITPARQSGVRRDLGLVLRQVRYEQRAYWRNRGRGIFTFVFPVMFLVIFASLNRRAHLVRGALASLLALEPDIEVVAQVARGDEVAGAAVVAHS